MTVWLILVSWGIQSICTPDLSSCEVETTRKHLASVVDMRTCLNLVLLLETNREYPHPDDHYSCEVTEETLP